jgi:hypothetical protein
MEGVVPLSGTEPENQPREALQRLIVFAGPAAVGKTTIVRKLREGRLPELAGRLDLGQAGNWHYTTGDKRPPPPSCRHVLLDYNALPAYRHGLAYEEEEALRLVGQAPRISFVTIWAPPERMARQFLADDLKRERRRAYQLALLLGRALPGPWRRRLGSYLLQRILDSSLQKALLGSRYKRFRERLLDFYTQPSSVEALYRQWFRFCERHRERTERSLIVQYDTRLQFLSREEWQEIVAKR